MDYNLYIDVLFVTDLLFELLTLSLASSIVRRRTSWFRIGAAACIGAVWTCLTAVFPVLPVWLELTATVILIGSVMAATAFEAKSSSERMQGCAALVFSSLILSGGVHFFTQFARLTDLEALACLGAVFLAARSFLKLCSKERAVGRERYQVKLYYRGNMKEFLALADSGNRLKEPESGKPVSVISYTDCGGFCEKVTAFLYIPYRAVGTEAGLLPGIVFEKMEILKDGKWVHVERPVVAVSREPLSEHGDFTMLLPEELVL